MMDRDGAETIASNNNVGPAIAPPTQRSIWFIRHGESESNAGLATPDPAFTGLTSTGHQQARRIAAACREIPSRVIVSHYQRTKQTALPTLEKFSLEPEVWDVHEFTYLGRLHGQTTTRQERSSHVDAYWYKLNPGYVDGDGSESFADFFLRTQRVVNRLLHMQERFIMVFSHEQFITAARWLLAAKKTFKRADIDVDLMMGFKHALTITPLVNGAILPVSVQNNRPVCGKVVTSHLGYKLNS
jgi:broad specificity phosphatase PhoE